MPKTSTAKLLVLNWPNCGDGEKEYEETDCHPTEVGRAMALKNGLHGPFEIGFEFPLVSSGYHYPSRWHAVPGGEIFVCNVVPLAKCQGTPGRLVYVHKWTGDPM